MDHDEITGRLTVASYVGTFLFGATALLGLILSACLLGQPYAAILGLLATACAYGAQSLYTVDSEHAGNGLRWSSLVFFAFGVLWLLVTA